MNENLTIREIKVAKRELEEAVLKRLAAAIAEPVATFQAKTGMSVNTIQLQYLDCTTLDDLPNRTSVPGLVEISYNEDYRSGAV